MVGGTRILIWSNNSSLEDYFVKQNQAFDLSFLSYKENIKIPYFLIALDLTQDLTNISQKLISFYSEAREKDQKLVLLLVSGKDLDVEKNRYFADLLDRLGNNKPLHRLVVARDLFLSDLLVSETWLEQYILSAIGNRKITISSKGENYLYPLSFNDLLSALKKIFFLNSTAGKTFWIFGDPMKDLDIAYLIKKNLEDTEGQEFEIDATGANDKNPADLNSFSNQSRALLNWQPIDDFSLSLKNAIKQVKADNAILISKIHHAQSQKKHPKLEKIKTLFRFFGKIFSVLESKKLTKKKIETGREFIKITFEWIITILVIIYFLFTVSFIGSSALALKYLENTLNKLRQGDLSASVRDLNTSKIFTGIGESSYSFVSPLVSSVAPDFHEKNYNTFIFLHYSQDSLLNLQQTYQLAQKIYQSIGESVDNQFYSGSSLALRSNLSQIYENLNQIKLLTESGKLPQILDEKLKSSPEFKNLAIVEDQIVQLLKVSELIPAFFSGSTAKNIIVLFQNTQELRPTGGAIDYVLSLVLDQGKLVSKKIYRSDELDTLAKGIAEAPPLIRQYTGINDWKMRDLNYNPDFPQTAVNVSWFIDKTLKFKPDLVLAVNDNLFSNFLQEDKGILINGQNITSEIFQKELATLSPSPTYSQLIDYYLNKILHHEISLISLGRVMASQTETNGLMIWAADSSVEKTIYAESYSGAIFPHSCHNGLGNARTCLSQTAYFNESNYSLVPLRDILERKIKHSVWLDTNQVRHEYLVDYQFNEKVSNINRELTEVIQIYVPQNSILQKVTLDKKEIPSNKIQQQQDNLLERFQIPVSMSFNNPHELIVQISTPLSENLLLPYAYSLAEYHQPGDLKQDIQVDLNFTPQARPVALTAPVTSGINTISLVLPAKTTIFGASFILGDN